jgi:hypothetical protein
MLQNVRKFRLIQAYDLDWRSAQFLADRTDGTDERYIEPGLPQRHRFIDSHATGPALHVAEIVQYNDRAHTHRGLSASGCA